MIDHSIVVDLSVLCDCFVPSVTVDCCVVEGEVKIKFSNVILLQLFLEVTMISVRLACGSFFILLCCECAYCNSLIPAIVDDDVILGIRWGHVVLRGVIFEGQ